MNTTPVYNDFKKYELENWMIVQTRNELYWLVDINHNLLLRPGEHMELWAYNDDLYRTGSVSKPLVKSEYDIMRVYTAKSNKGHMLKMFMYNKIDHHYVKDLTLLWERDETPVEMTLAQIKEELGIPNLKIIEEN